MSSDSELDEFYDAEEATPVKLQRFDMYIHCKLMVSFFLKYISCSKITQTLYQYHLDLFMNMSIFSAQTILPEVITVSLSH